MTTHAALRPNAAAIERHFGLDWLRTAAFGLLILHHIARVFVEGDWLVKLAELHWLTVPVLFVTPWRLALLFVIAGYASRALLARLGRRAFLRERSVRLLVPLLAAMLLIIPPQSWISLTLNHGYGHGFSHYLIHDAFRFGTVHGVTLPGWEHLWFVFYLWAYTFVAVAGAVWMPVPLRARLGEVVGVLLAGRRLLWLPLLYFVPARIAVAFTLGESHGLFNDWVSDIIYLPCFLLGFGLAGTAGLWAAVARCWRPALAVALVSFVPLAWIELSYAGNAQPPHLLMALDRGCMAALMWAMVLALLRAADTILNRDHPARARLSEAVFPFYIIHQTIIVVLAWALLTRDLSNAAAFVVILCGTISGCWLFYRLGDLVPAVRPLIGLKPRSRRTGGLAPIPAPLGSAA